MVHQCLMDHNSYLKCWYQNKLTLLLRKHSCYRKQQNKTPKYNISLNWWYNVVHTAGCIRSCCTKLSNSKAIFEHSLPVGCYLQAVSLLVLSMGRSQWQVFCFWHISALEFLGLFVFPRKLSLNAVTDLYA